MHIHVCYTGLVVVSSCIFLDAFNVARGGPAAVEVVGSVTAVMAGGEGVRLVAIVGIGGTCRRLEAKKCSRRSLSGRSFGEDGRRKTMNSGGNKNKEIEKKNRI